jgi:hypothetical protein
LSEKQLFRSGALEKTNLCFAFFADIRFFESFEFETFVNFQVLYKRQPGWRNLSIIATI